MQKCLKSIAFLFMQKALFFLASVLCGDQKKADSWKEIHCLKSIEIPNNQIYFNQYLQ